jgi:hypothetical protein
LKAAADARRRQEKSKNFNWLKYDEPAFSRLNSAAVPTPVMVHFAMSVNLNHGTSEPCGEALFGQFRNCSGNVAKDTL